MAGCRPSAETLALQANVTAAQERAGTLEKQLNDVLVSLSASNDSLRTCTRRSDELEESIEALREEVADAEKQAAREERIASACVVREQECNAELAKYKPTVVPSAGYKTISFDDLMRNSEQYKGTGVKLSGEVLQVLDGDGEYQLRVAVTPTDFGFYEDPVLVHYTGPRVLEDDVVTVRGTFIGLMTYEAIFGNPITLPEIQAASLTVDVKAGDRT